MTDLPAPLHLGGLHPYEQALTLLVAFGPFVLLAAVIWWRRRQDAAEAAEAEQRPREMSYDEE